MKNEQAPSSLRQFTRRALTSLAWAAVAGAMMPAAASTDFPTRPVKLIAPLAPGGTTDIVARVLAEYAGRHLGQPIVVENRAGAGGIIGSGVVAAAPADGYTLLMGTIGTLAVAPSMSSQMPYDTDRAFAPVSQVSASQFILATSAAVPAHDLPSFLAYAKSKPGVLSYGSAGNGSTLHLGMELLKSLAGLDIVHIPYKSSGQMVGALVANEVQAGLPDMPSAIPFIKSGQLKPIALTGKTRAAALPGTPTIAESGFKDYELAVWLGVLAPAGTPPAIVNKLNAAIVAALKDPEVVSKLASMDTTPIGSSPAAFGDFIRSERKKWDPIIKRSGVRMN
jgi:tripartite-type tricarboxylate transporter receptor subunit TctC